MCTYDKKEKDMFIVSRQAKEAAIGRKGTSTNNWEEKLHQGVRIILVSCVGTLVPYEVFEPPAERNGLMQLRLRHLLVSSYSKWLDKNPESGYHSLANLGILPHMTNAREKKWSSADYTYDAPTFKWLYEQHHIKLQSAPGSYEWRWAESRLRDVLSIDEL